MRTYLPLPPSCRALAVVVLLACVGCGKLDRNQGDVAGGPGKIVSVGGASGGGNGGGADAHPDSGGLDGAGCLRPGTSAACGRCEATMCTTNLFIYGEGFDAATYDPSDPNNASEGNGVDWYNLCYKSTGTIATGPMKGAKKSVICAQVVDCLHASGCDPSDPNFPCYCGAGVTADECVSQGFTPRGPCKDVIEWGAESTDPITVANRSLDFAYASGDAMGLVSSCDYPNDNWSMAPCQAACLGGGDGGMPSCTTADGGVPTDGGGSLPDASGQAGAGGQSGGGGGGAGGSGGGCATTYTFADEAACADCALNSASSFCVPSVLTATVTSDDDGNPVANGFGPDTLPTKAQRDASFAIIQRALALRCYSDTTVRYRPADMPGCETLGDTQACVSADLGCLLDLGQAPSNVLSGIFATSPTYSALAEYEAAAIADAAAGPATPDRAPAGWGAPGGVPVGASNATLGYYVSTQAVHPSSAIGLADLVLRCALNTPCSPCFDLKATTTCPNGGSGGGGAAGGGGGGAAGGGGTGGGGAAGSFGGAGGTGGGGSSDGAGGTRSTGGAGGGAAGASGSICPDLDGDGVPDCTQTLVQNPGFDSATTGWKAEPATTASWTSQDGNGKASSGAIAVVNSDTNPADAPYGATTGGAFQCLTVTPGSCYQVDAQVSIPSGQASVAAGFVIDEHTTGDCSQPPFTSFVSPQISSIGAWQTVSGTTTQVPLGVASAAVRLVAVKPMAQASAEALFDNVLIRVATCASP